MEIIKKHKVDLTGVLSADPGPIVQRAHSRGIITEREYCKVKNITDPEEKVIELLDQVMTKSDQTCQAFLDILRQVHDTYPKLKDLFTDAKESDISFSAGQVYHRVQVDGGSIAIAPFIMSPVVSDFNMPVTIKSSPPVCSSSKPMPPSPLSLSIEARPETLDEEFVSDGNDPTLTLADGSQADARAKIHPDEKTPLPYILKKHVFESIKTRGFFHKTLSTNPCDSHSLYS